MSDDFSGISEPEIDEVSEQQVKMAGEFAMGGLSEPSAVGDLDPGQPEQAVEEEIDWKARAEAAEAEKDRIARESAGRLNDVVAQRAELREMRETVESLNKRFDDASAPEPVSKDEDPIAWQEAQAQARDAETKARLERIEAQSQAESARRQIETLGKAANARLESELGGDDAKRADYEARLAHVTNNIKAIAMAQGVDDATADAQVQLMILKATAGALQSGQSLTELVKQYSDQTGYKGSAPVEQAPTNPAVTTPAERQVPQGVRISLSSLPGNIGQRKVTLAQLDQADDSVYSALYAGDADKWREIHKRGFTYL